MMNVFSLHLSQPLNGNAIIAVLVGSHCMVKLFGPNLAHIGELISAVDRVFFNTTILYLNLFKIDVSVIIICICYIFSLLI